MGGMWGQAIEENAIFLTKAWSQYQCGWSGHPQEEPLGVEVEFGGQNGSLSTHKKAQ